MKNKVFMYSMGCSRRLLDDTKLSNYFSLNGFQIINNPKNADYILLSTCAYKRHQEDEAIKKVKELKKYKGKLIVCGCLPKINEKRLRSIFKGDTFTPSNINYIDKIFPQFKIKFSKLGDANKLIIQSKFGFNFYSLKLIIKYFKSKIFKKYDSAIFVNYYFNYCIPWNYFIRVCWGCLGNCAYCGIRNAIGKLKSKPIETCIKELKEGLREGYSNFNIIADDVGAYGLDCNKTFPELLNKTIKINKSISISIRDIHPKWVIKYLDQLIPIVKGGNIKLISCPIESGNDRILKLMNRYNNSSEIVSTLSKLKKAYPKLKIITQIIVGFPSETERELENTLNMIKKIKFDFVLIFPYHEKENTIASKLKGKLSERIIKERVKKVFYHLKREGINCFCDEL